MVVFALLFAGAVVAHSGVKTIVVDGVTYPPFNSRLDNFLEPGIRRIEWGHDIVVTPFNPITNLSDPALTCNVNPRAPALTAPARAGAEVTFHWTGLVRMHQGPIMAYMGALPSSTAKPQDVKFFKIFEQGFDPARDEWANQIAVDNNDTYSVTIPGDIAPGTYILRTELLALHGNMANLNNGPLAGPQFYVHCFNIDVIGSGAAKPEGVSIPGAYKPTDFGLAFSPYEGAGSGTEQNSKYVPPGPRVYKAASTTPPSGPAPTVKETGVYTGDVAVAYAALAEKLEKSGAQLVKFVNAAWPAYQPDSAEFKKYPKKIQEATKERDGILKDVDALKALIKKQQAN